MHPLAQKHGGHSDRQQVTENELQRVRVRRQDAHRLGVGVVKLVHVLVEVALVHQPVDRHEDSVFDYDAEVILP